MATTWQKNWKASREYPRLEEGIFSDVAIVGGGITGITLAYLLAASGKRVVVLEGGTLARSSYTAYTTAMITAQIDTNFSDLVKILGPENAKVVWRSGMDAIDTIAEIIKKENISCEFSRVPLYVYANNKKEWTKVREEGLAARGADLPVSVKESGTDLKIQNAGYYVLGDQAKFHPLKYCDALRGIAQNSGVEFYENTKVLGVVGGDPYQLRTPKGQVSASFVVIATYDPFNKPRELFAKKGMYKSYMCELSISKGTLPPGLYVDGATPYHYFRVDEYEDKAEDRLIIGGADHRQEIKMDPAKNYAAILEYADKILGKGNYKVENQWDGGILETIDGLPYIGRYKRAEKNIFVATGFSGNGMTYSMIAAKIIMDFILGKENPRAKIFDPTRRSSLRAIFLKGRDYVSIFFHGAARNIFRH